MRRRLATVAAILALAGASVVGPMAVPASAHHTHSPTTICNLIVSTWNGQVSGSNPFQLVAAYQYYDSSGHPLKARCLIRDNRTQVTHCRYIYYSTHGIRYC